MKVYLTLARQEGFEPPTYWFVASHSIQLSYWRIKSHGIFKCRILIHYTLKRRACQELLQNFPIKISDKNFPIFIFEVKNRFFYLFCRCGKVESILNSKTQNEMC